LSSRCSGITKGGTRCARSAEGPNGLCWLHDPSRSEERKRAASKAGKGKPNKEVRGIKARLEDLADGVLLGTIDKADAAVVGQIWNTYLRAVSVELKVREQMDLVERLEALEQVAHDRKGGASWGA
jgi:hypothetical protein